MSLGVSGGGAEARTEAESEARTRTREAISQPLTEVTQVANFTGSEVTWPAEADHAQGRDCRGCQDRSVGQMSVEGWLLVSVLQCSGGMLCVAECVCISVPACETVMELE